MIERQVKVIKTFILEEGQVKGTVSAQMAMDSLKLIRERLLEWKNERPSLPGIYIYRNDREWVHQYINVEKGDWRLARNPDWLYGNQAPLHQIEPGWWFGPIPESPKSCFHNDD